jgi:oxygen-independent coproporphyrinogen-3 oxidase
VLTPDQDLLTEHLFQLSGLSADFGARARLGIYVHVPFCPHICPYCDFVKTARFTKADVDAFFAALPAQLEMLLERVPEQTRVATVYLGGGTPSLFPAQRYKPLVEKIKARFEIEEFTVESNPFSNIERHFKDFFDLGVNRITLGAQSLNPEVLNYLGRKHSREQVIQNILSARSAGIENIQVDLIFGIKPLAQRRDIVSEIEALAHSGASGVSCYLLTIEETTAFRKEENASDDAVVDEYERIAQACARLGFIQHETSNFSKTPALHNRLYWYGLPYLGLGTGAHGLLPPTSEHPLGRRYQVGQLQPRMLAGDDELSFKTDTDNLFEIVWNPEHRSRSDMLQEMLFTLLRTQMGIPLAWLNVAYPGRVIERLWQDARVKRALQAGLLQRTPTHLRLAPAEKLRGDSWAVHLASLLHPE